VDKAEDPNLEKKRKIPARWMNTATSLGVKSSIKIVG
jgi:hypothetical protein